jgi:hypothetical protein
MNSIKVLTVLMLLTAAPGCILVDEHHHPACVGEGCVVSTGEMLFYWAFELADGTVTDQCDVAEIAKVDITIYNGFGDLEFSAIDNPCGDLGAIIDNFLLDTYTIELQAMCTTGRFTHSGQWTVDLYEGSNDFGTLTLGYDSACL